MAAQPSSKNYLQESQKSIPKTPGSTLLAGIDLRRSASPTSLFTAKRKLSRDTNGNINKMDSFRIGELNSSICDELEDKHIGLSGFGSVKASISKLDRFVTFTSAAQDNKKLTTQHSFVEGRINSSLIENDSTSKLRKKLSGANVSPALEVITRKSQKLLNVIGRDSSISKLGKLSQTLKNNSNMSSGLFEGSNGVAAQNHNSQLKSRNLGSRVINTIKECRFLISLSPVCAVRSRNLLLHEFEFQVAYDRRLPDIEEKQFEREHDLQTEDLDGQQQRSQSQEQHQSTGTVRLESCHQKETVHQRLQHCEPRRRCRRI